MKFLPLRHALLATALIVSACASPTTMSPGGSADELAAERAEQERILEASKGQTPVAGVEDLDTNEAYYTDRVGRISGQIIEAGQKVCGSIGKDPRSCKFNIVVENGKDLNAYADGTAIHLTTTMVRFTQSDEELAFIVSHEYAHNALRHVAAAQQNAMTGGLIGLAVDSLAASQGYDTKGNFGKIGQEQGVLRYSVGFEGEADYVGLYIAYHAGFPIERAPDIWRRMTAAAPAGLYTRTTHPTNPERYLAMQKTVAEIRAKEAAGQPVLPNFKAKD